MTSKDYRARAREILAGKWGMAILVTLIAAILGATLVGSFGFNLDIDEETLTMLPEGIREIVVRYMLIVGSFAGVLGIVQFILGGVVQLGYCKYLLKLHDGEEAELKDLFSQLSTRFADGFVLSLLSAIYIALWTLLFIIPGIVATYKYALAPFILLENPDMKPNDAITESKERMSGYKGALFCLDFSFIGWAFLSALTLGIGSLWLNPYQNMARTAFYRSLCPKAIPEVAESEILEAEVAAEPEIPQE